MFNFEEKKKPSRLCNYRLLALGKYQSVWREDNTRAIFQSAAISDAANEKPRDLGDRDVENDCCYVDRIFYEVYKDERDIAAIYVYSLLASIEVRNRIVPHGIGPSAGKGTRYRARTCSLRDVVSVEYIALGLHV